MNKWHWVLELAGNATGTLSLGIFTFLLGGIAIAKTTTFGSIFGEPWVLYLLCLWGIALTERFSDDLFRFGGWGKIKEPHGNWYWPLEFSGHAISVIGLGWMIIVNVTAQIQGYHTFYEPDSLILWPEILALVVMWAANALNWFNDIRRSRQGGNS